mmetsp:Transcript_58832/g.126603  ORF Transcript_58832/g.126603 Transcript_58832/m.126603 type:complete len:485 (+) Transcript_58832:781-2235(+)
MLLLALCSGIRNGLVQILDSLLELRNLIAQAVQIVVVVLHFVGQGHQLVLQLLLRLLCLVQLFLAVVVLGVIIRLLLLEGLSHVVHHLDHLVEAYLLRSQRQRDQVQLGTGNGPPSRGNHAQSLALQCFVGLLYLQQRRGGNGLLEELQSIVTVENLDGVGDGDYFVRTGLLGLLVELLLLGTVLGQLLEVALVGCQCPLNTLEVVGVGGDLDCELPRAGGLVFDGLGGRLDLLALGRAQACKIGRRFGLCLLNLSQPVGHLLDHGLQDTHDLVRPRALRSLLEIFGNSFFVVVCGSAHSLQQRSPISCLQESRGRPLLNRCDGLLHGIQIGLQIGALGLKILVLLLAEAGGLCDHLVGLVPLGVVLHELLIDLLLLRRIGLNGGGQVINLLLLISNGGCELLGARVTRALKLCEQGLLLFSFFLNLLLHGLQHGYHPPDGVGIHLGLQLHRSNPSEENGAAHGCRVRARASCEQRSRAAAVLP